MRLAVVECGHCGVDYTCQYSGNYNAVGVDKKYQDHEYCPDCKKAIVDALEKVPVKFKWEFIETDEVSLSEIIKAEEDFYDNIEKEREKSGKLLLPIARRVFSNLYNAERGETSKSGEVKYNDKLYRYRYWPSKPEEATITVKTRMNLETGKPA